MRLILIILLSFLVLSHCASHYIMGEQGQSCNHACYKAQKNCNPKVETNNGIEIFEQLGINCQGVDIPWFGADQPAYISDPADLNYGKCLGYIDVPDAVQCSTTYPGAQRLCRCDDPADSSTTFGTGYSSGLITTEERMIFQHFVNPGDVGVMTHFWITYSAQVEKGVMIRYYIDGEEEASIQFTPSLFCGVGFYDNKGPWGTEWFGKGAKDAGWYNNFRIPFQKSIAVTVQHEYAIHDGFYMILRGSVNIPIIVGGKTLPTTARMNQVRINDTYGVIDWVPLVNVTSGPGVHWMVTLAAESGNLAFLEGCVHAYFDGKNDFPGIVLATGTEDYFDSAWYFNGGEFYFPSAGFTHFSEGPGHVAFSAYKFHDKDPLFFKNGFQLIWRNGDMDDRTGMKCHIISGGKIHDNPTVSKIYAYSWYYTWPEDEK